MRRTNKNERLSREAWLAEALDELSQHGQAGLGIEKLSRSLGVSRGSFYWHFASREEFVIAMLNYWHESFTVPVPDAIEKAGGTPQERLLNLFEMVYKQRLSRYDLPIRAWAHTDPAVAKQVKRTDRVRLAYIRHLFAEMGFAEPELGVRSRACLSYLSFDDMLFDRRARGERSKELRDRHAFFVRK